ncbi:uncharacterized protein LOC117191722 [Drosophila miranda]|uniref:uncharacterized protein LOC117191722 n=1 Tax=Drosophila miranda TaxID=7229 RepID=UPI00143F734E|nr:uncharacterized protein LOC117191722 [Drosophila miranda]
MKRRLLETFGESEDSKMGRLLRGGDMTGKKPSEILLHLRRLAPASGCEAVIRNLFLTELPPSIRPLISVWEENDLDKLAKIADKMIENSAIESMCVMSTQPNSAEHIQQSVDAVLELDLGLDRSFKWSFDIADFLAQFQLLIEIKKQRLNISQDFVSPNIDKTH